jgi:hypothetical protein
VLFFISVERGQTKTQGFCFVGLKICHRHIFDVLTVHQGIYGDYFQHKKLRFDGFLRRNGKIYDVLISKYGKYKNKIGKYDQKRWKYSKSGRKTYP